MYLCKFLNTHPPRCSISLHSVHPLPLSSYIFLLTRDVCIGQAKVFSWAVRRPAGEESRASRRVPGIKEFAILNFRRCCTYPAYIQAHIYDTSIVCINRRCIYFALKQPKRHGKLANLRDKSCDFRFFLSKYSYFELYPRRHFVEENSDGIDYQAECRCLRIFLAYRNFAWMAYGK